MSDRRTAAETKARIIELLREGCSTAEIAQALGMQTQSVRTYKSALRADGVLPAVPDRVSPDDDWDARVRRANKDHLADLARHHAPGCGELAFAPCDLATAVANTRRLMRGAREARFSQFTSTAGLCGDLGW